MAPMRARASATIEPTLPSPTTPIRRLARVCLAFRPPCVEVSGAAGLTSKKEVGAWCGLALT